MSNLATRLEKIEAQTDDTIAIARTIGNAIRNIVDGIDDTAALRAARDRLAAIASPYDKYAQYNLSVAAVMLGEVEPPDLFANAETFVP